MEKSLLEHKKIKAVQRFNSNEMNLLLIISSKLNKTKKNKVTLTFEEIDKHTNFSYSYTYKYDYFNGLGQLIMEEYENSISNYQCVIKSFIIDSIGKQVTFFINSDLVESILEISKDFSNDNFDVFLNLTSTYAKSAYLLVKIMSRCGKYIIDMNDFKRLLNIPEKYQMSDIDKKVFFQIEKNLAKHFTEFRIEKINITSQKKIGYLKFNIESKELAKES